MLINRFSQVLGIALALTVFSAQAAKNEVEISQRPLGVVGDVPPNLALALSVEYPTAGAAYDSSGVSNGDNTAQRVEFTTENFKKRYLGYFDPDKCYEYITRSNFPTGLKNSYAGNPDGYFRPVGRASSAFDYIGLCDPALNAYSGNFLNWASMTVLDIFRSATTGGNRAFGRDVCTNDANASCDGERFEGRDRYVGWERSAIANRLGDREDKTFLRRARVWREVASEVRNFNGGSIAKSKGGKLTAHYGNSTVDNVSAIAGNNYNLFPLRTVALDLNTPRDVTFIRSILPTRMVNELVKWAKKKDNLIASDSPDKDSTEVTKVYIGFENREYFLRPQLHVKTSANPCRRTMIRDGKEVCISRDRVDDWHVVPLEGELKPGDTGQNGSPRFPSLIEHAIKDKRTNKRNIEYLLPLTVVVQVCDPNHGLEANCVRYGNNYKPEGLLQKYGRNGMRVAALGYLNIQYDHRPQAFIDILYRMGIPQGGVLRARMKYLAPNTDALRDQDNIPLSSSVPESNNAEWNARTGQFNFNPDVADASRSKVATSGVINYVNHFGESSGYRTFDPASELYYTALSYLRYRGQGAVPYDRTTLGVSDGEKDGFPAIYDWRDPLTDGLDNPALAQCRQNSILYIGDTNTWPDSDIFGVSGSRQPNTNSNNIDVTGYTNSILTQEGVGGSWNSAGFGVDQIANGKRATPLIAGLAYWGRVNDIRPDLKGVQRTSSFLIDVMEGGNSKMSRNSNHNHLWLAAKYGGFDIDNEPPTSGSVFASDAPKLNLPDSRILWTDDAPNQTSNSDFPLGIPRNFAVGNNPENLTLALRRSFASAGARIGSQASVSVYNATEKVDFAEDAKPIALDSSYNSRDWSGDLVASEIGYVAGSVTNPQEPLMFHKSKWSASRLLNRDFRGGDNGNNYLKRKIYTIPYSGGQAQVLNVNSADNVFRGMPGIGRGISDISAVDLTKYLMGSADREGTWRIRRDLLGSIIHSSPAVIKPLRDDEKAQGCTYSVDVSKRKLAYAVAANDGFLHIFGDDGHEKAAYLPRGVMPKLAEYVKSSSDESLYLNDGTPKIVEVCMRGTAKSILVGTAGRGAASVYAVDVTDPTNLNQNHFLWEFSSFDDGEGMGLAISEVELAYSQTGKPVAIFSSGFNNKDGKGYLYIVNLDKNGSSWTKGVNYQRIELGSSGVGTPFVYVQPGETIVKKIFVGDNSGKLWQIDNNSGTFSVAYSGKPLFTPKTPEARPIFARPIARGYGSDILVVVGTGRYLNLRDLSAREQNYGYGFMVKSDSSGGVITPGSLLQQEVQANSKQRHGTSTNYYSVTDNVDKSKRGWRLKLLPGWVIADSATIRSDRLAEFVAVNRSMGEHSSNSCVELAGSTTVISVDKDTGGRFGNPIFDVNGDGNFNESDAISGGGQSGGYVYPSAVQLSGTLSPSWTVVSSEQGDFAIIGDPRHSVRLNTFEHSSPFVRRLSWREIF